MKKVLVILSLGTLLFAGGDIFPPKKYRNNDINKIRKEITKQNKRKSIISHKRMNRTTVNQRNQRIISHNRANRTNEDKRIISHKRIDITNTHNRVKRIKPTMKLKIKRRIRHKPVLDSSTTKAKAYKSTSNNKYPAKRSSPTTRFYIGMTGSHITSNSKVQASVFADTNETRKETALAFIAGYKINPNLDAEIRYINGMGKGTVAKPNTRNISIYIKPKYYITNATNLYALLGYGMRNNADINDQNKNKMNVNFGAGIAYDINEHLNIYFDVINYVIINNETSQMYLNSGCNYNF
jgi:predicted porin